MFSFVSALYMNPLSEKQLGKNFSHSVGCIFTRIMMSLAIQKLFSFMCAHLLVGLSACATRVLFRKPFSIQVSSCLLLRSIFHSDNYPVFPVPFDEVAIFPLMCILGFLSKI